MGEPLVLAMGDGIGDCWTESCILTGDQATLRVATEAKCTPEDRNAVTRLVPGWHLSWPGQRPVVTLVSRRCAPRCETMYAIAGPSSQPYDAGPSGQDGLELGVDADLELRSKRRRQKQFAKLRHARK